MKAFSFLNDALEARHFEHAPISDEVQASGTRVAAAFRWLKIPGLQVLLRASPIDPPADIIGSPLTAKSIYFPSCARN